MVARHKIHRYRPSVQRRKTRQAEIRILQFRAVLVGANIPGQHQKIRLWGWTRRKIGLRFQMQVREQLQLH